jgi:hypothetical protein
MPAAARKPSTNLPTPAELLDLIAARKAELPALLKRQNETAEASVASGDESQYNEAVAAMAAAHRDIERLQAALVGATARSREEAEAQQRAAAAAIRERFYKRIDGRHLRGKLRARSESSCSFGMSGSRRTTKPVRSIPTVRRRPVWV